MYDKRRKVKTKFSGRRSQMPENAMLVVLEGIDNSGKSTLAYKLQQILQWKVQSSEGPPKYRGEINERVMRYKDLDNVICDRHPIISNPLYEEAFDRHPRETIDGHLLAAFYANNPLIIYCDPIRRELRDYIPNRNTESPEHIDNLHSHYQRLLTLYRGWALERANMLYRIGDDDARLVEAVEAIAMGDCT